MYVVILVGPVDMWTTTKTPKGWYSVRLLSQTFR